MSDIMLNNVPSMNVNKLINELSHIYISAIRGGIQFKSLPSVMLWGPPGVGKSQAVRQLAEEIKARKK